MPRRYFAVIAAILLMSGIGVSSLAVVQAKDDFIPPVCYVVEIQYHNIGSSTETVNAYVIRVDTWEATSATHTFTLQAHQTGTFRLVLFIPNPDMLFQFLAGTWISNPNMVITNYYEDFLSIQDCIGHVIGDGRINDGENEKAAPLVAYCEDGGIGVYDVDPQSHGNLVFRVAYDDVKKGLAKAQADGTPVTLGNADDDFLYALSSEELQLSGPEQFTGKPYNYIFAGDFCGDHK